MKSLMRLVTVALDYDGVLTTQKLRELTDDPNAIKVESADSNGVMADTIALHKSGNMEERLKKARKIAPYASRLLLIDTEERQVSSYQSPYPDLVCPDRSFRQRQVYVL
ncbi:MAG: hypothetical protein II240_07480 [Bacteroidaceae bacterium]|nr:hypothetical protein [Bacteroidaceae bacterium]